MNEQNNTKLIQQAYGLVQKGDMPSFLNLLAADVLWQMPEIENVPFAGSWHGREQVGEFFKRVNASQDVIEFEPREFIAQGNKVVVLGRFTMHVKATGKDSRAEWAHVWTVEGGAITKVQEYVDSLSVSRAHTS